MAGNGPTLVRGRLDAADAGDRGALMVSWFLKIAVVIALLGTLAFDGITIMETRTHGEDAAADAAQAASLNFLNTQNATAAVAAGVLAAQTLDGVTVLPANVKIMSNDAVTVTVTVMPKTFIIGRLPGTTSLNTYTTSASRQASSEDS
jgi:hypothetical protein